MPRYAVTIRHLKGGARLSATTRMRFRGDDDDVVVTWRVIATDQEAVTYGCSTRYAEHCVQISAVSLSKEVGSKDAGNPIVAFMKVLDGVTLGSAQTARAE